MPSPNPYEANQSMPFLNAPTIVAGTLLLAVSPMAETLEFIPKANTTIVRTLELQATTTVDGATVSVMDQEIDAGEGIVSSHERQVRIVDKLGKVEDGRLLDFVRSYEGIQESTETEGAGEGIEVKTGDGEASDLEGQKVAYTWDPKEEAYEAKYTGEGEPGDDEWLTDLTASLDMVSWLPDSEVEVDSKWEMSLDELAPVIWFGGRLYPTQATEDGDKPEGGVAISVPDLSDTHMLKGCDGQIRLTLERVEEEGGGRIAFVTFELTGSVDQDLSDAATELNEARGDDQVFDVAEQSIEMTGTGELRWDLEANRLVSLTLDLEQDIEENAEWAVTTHGMDMEVSFTSTKSTTYHIELGLEQS